MAALTATLDETARGCPAGLAPVAEQFTRADPSAFVRQRDGKDTIELLVRGAKCAGCIRKIESGLIAQAGVEHVRLNLSTGRLTLAWRAGANTAQGLVTALAAIGYDSVAFDPDASRREIDQTGRDLLRCLAVSAFAAMNIMMFSVPIWLGSIDMGEATRTGFYWMSALIAVPAALYSGRPFFRSAWNALKRGRANMDVPISIAVFLTLGMSVAEVLMRGHHAYFDGVVMLLFLLLIGRYLDHVLRERARSAAKDLIAMQTVTAAKLDDSGYAMATPASALRAGDRIALAAGDRNPIDGIIERGRSEIDLSILTGETLPVPAAPGDEIKAGAINLTHGLIVRVTKRVEDSTIADLARLVEIGEQGRTRFVRLADRAAALYVPIVHTLAAATFLGWMFAPALLRQFGFGGAADIGVMGALQNAVAVLIITCPCALGLAIPAVQVVATSRLFRRGVLVKSGDALERIAQADYIVLDKTGTLTLGRPRLNADAAPATVKAAASLARASRHPLSRALVEAAGPGIAADNVREFPGDGLEGKIDGAPARLGRRAFAAPEAPDSSDGSPELWFSCGDKPSVRLTFSDALRSDARDAIAALRERGLDVELLSGDRPSAVSIAAAAAGIAIWRGCAQPGDKIARLEQLKAQGKRPMMIGDGLNDAAALAAAHVSVSPGSAIDISQAAADIVVQGEAMSPIVVAIDVARRSKALMLQNLGFSALYNVIAIPFAVFGFITPLIAAVAMASSSLIVMANAARLSASFKLSAVE